MTKSLLTALCLLFCTSLWGVNPKTTVEQVTTTVTLTDDVDYIIKSSTPFTTSGIVNIENTEHAVLILAEVRPSKAIGMLAHVKINGQNAVNNTNCQVKLYNRGSIILPYGNSVKPLTVYAEQNFEGESCNDFGLENSNGYMNTLSDQKLNNRIRSFKLKRGYMVTFSLRANGRGYSRCFIAADADLEMAQLPAILDRSISSYRVFKWYDAGKPALANDTREESVDKLHVTSCYSFGLGESRLPDAECVPHHIYEDWPSSAACGSVNYSPHMKTNNEPGNSADDTPQSVETILNNWENLMATGMRLCSPSSHDGSLNHLRDFLSAIDERGWRCDIVDLHCYWPEWNFYNSIKTWVDSYHRPIWISEWVWGASWNNNGIFGEAQGSFRDNPTQAQLNRNRDVVQNICNALNSYDYIERYYYWNSEANCSKLYYNGQLTPAGVMYSQLDGGVGYNGKYDYAPRAPKQKDPDGLVIFYDKDTNTAAFAWNEYNHEMNEYIHLERRTASNKPWEVVKDITGYEYEGFYIIKDIEAQSGWQFRIVEKDANGTERRTKTVTAASSDVEAGDAVTVDGKTLYMGGNVLMNGEFDLGFYGWTNGQGQPLALPWYQVVPIGGSDGGAYLQCYGNSTQADAEQSIKTLIDITPDTWYYFTADACNLGGVFNLLSLTVDGTKNDSVVAMLDNTTANWVTQYTTFYSGHYDKAMLSMRALGSRSQLDKVALLPLFDTQEKAYADGAARERRRADAYMQEVGSSCDFSSQLQIQYDDPKEDMKYVRQLVDQAIEGSAVLPKLYAMSEAARKLTSQYHYPGYEEVNRQCDEVEEMQNIKCLPGAEWVLTTYKALREALDAYMPFSTIEDKIQQPTFANTAGWQTKAGTYKGGDQRTNTYDGMSFWNAWWNLPKEGNEQQTMAIRQDVSGLMHGLYAVECEAATEHYCISDQHAYISNGTETSISPVLSADYMDLITVSTADTWQTLTSQPVYVGDDDVAAIGFESSKQGAIDLAWREVGNTNSQGDHREGWWGATNFRLRYHPLYRIATLPGVVGVSCLPYDVLPSDGIKFYQIAAITSDYQNLCLEEISRPQAGVPFLYVSTNSVANFLEYGEAVDTESDGPGNLRGILKKKSNISRVPKGYYVLIDGVWTKVGDDRPNMENYSGIIRPMTDKSSKHVPVVDHWNGLTMPIVGVTEEEIAASIGTPLTSHLSPLTSPLYDLQGRRLKSDRPTQKGVYIINHKKYIVR